MARVLIVDDDRQNRELLAIMLGAEFTLMTAASGEAALAIITAQPPDIILLDVMLPGLDGYQVVEAIKGEVRTRHIPIILITGLDDYGAETRGRDAGAEDFLSRPVDRADLSLRIRKLLPPASAMPS
jgi:CheY-like chemotaxis protein